MPVKHFIDSVYELALDKYHDKSFTFDSLRKELVKKLKLSIEEQEDLGVLYTDLLQDVRFVFLGNKTWRLSEFVTRDKKASLQNSLYDFNQASDEEELDYSYDYADQEEDAQDMNNANSTDYDEEEYEEDLEEK